MNPCEHYNKNCKLYTSCCNKIYPCHRCHDNVEYEENLNKNTIHRLNKDTVQLICIKCDTKQDISNQCISCKIEFGKYFCQICLLHDFTDKEQYHCNFCKICRVGRSVNEHCQICSYCQPRDHKCKGLNDTNNTICPICFEDLYTSQISNVFMPCGHIIHQTCYKEYIKTKYTCPLCYKSIHDMQSYYEFLEREIQATEMPVEYRDINIEILCNDCNVKSTVKFHILGFKCSNCKSYNTRRI